MSQQVYFNIEGWGITFSKNSKDSNHEFFPWYVHIPCGKPLIHLVCCPACEAVMPYKVTEKLFALFAWVKPLPLEVDEPSLL